MRLLMIAALAPAEALFPADPPAAPRALARTRPLAAPGRALCSPLLRARQTAAALGLVPEIVPALAELDYGVWAGRAPEAVLAEDPEGFALWRADPAAAPHGGESRLQLIARVADWLENCPGPGGAAIAVTHPGAIQAALIHVLGAPPEAADRIGASGLARLRLSHDGRRWSVLLEP